MSEIRTTSAVIDNTIRSTASVNGNVINVARVHIGDSAPIIYNGEYEYIPMVTSQMIYCSQKKMLQNVKINAIQTRETVDSTGGVNFEVLSGTEGDNYGI